MSGATQGALRILTALLLCTLTPQLLRAQVSPFIDPDLSLSALTPPHAGTTLVSSATAVLRDASNRGERLIKQLIMGHSVADLNTQTQIYQKRVISETGDASNQATMPGVLSHCYIAMKRAWRFM